MAKVKPTQTQRMLVNFAIAYLLIFTLLAFSQQNYEFLIYSGIMALSIPLIWAIHLRYNLGTEILIGLFMLGILHMLGGLWVIDGKRLYAHYIIDDVLRIDKIIHTFGIFFATLGAYKIVSANAKRELSSALLIFTIFIGMGIGALWEMLEFVPVMTLPETGVGKYFNTMGDIIADTVGAILAVLVIKFGGRK